MAEMCMATLTVEQSIGRAFSDIPAVERVHVFQRGELLNVFTIVEDDDESAFDLIYDRERSIIRQFRDFHFDFNVIARRGRSIPEILSFGAPVWQRRESDPCPNANSI
jgi:hypothetical protein